MWRWLRVISVREGGREGGKWRERGAQQWRRDSQEPRDRIKCREENLAGRESGVINRNVDLRKTERVKGRDGERDESTVSEERTTYNHVQWKQIMMGNGRAGRTVSFSLTQKPKVSTTKDIFTFERPFYVRVTHLPSARKHTKSPFSSNMLQCWLCWAWWVLVFAQSSDSPRLPFWIIAQLLFLGAYHFAQHRRDRKKSDISFYCQMFESEESPSQSHYSVIHV